MSQQSQKVVFGQTMHRKGGGGGGSNYQRQFGGGGGGGRSSGGGIYQTNKYGGGHSKHDIEKLNDDDRNTDDVNDRNDPTISTTEKGNDDPNETRFWDTNLALQ